jgi:CRP-like cAMP-binding protein
MTLEYRPDFITKTLQYFKKSEIYPNTSLFDPKTGILNFVCVSKLTEGMAFGEKGLDVGAPRNATVICIRNCDFACVLKRDYDLLLKDMTKVHFGNIREFFFKDVFKQEIGRAMVDNISADFCKLTLTLPKGSIVFQQGCLDNRVYIIKQGIIQFEHSVALNKNKSETPIDKMKRCRTVQRVYDICRVAVGEVLGEECVYSAEPKTFTARVYSDTATLYYVSHQCMKSYTTMVPVVSEFFKRIYTERLNFRNQLLTNLLIKTKVIQNPEDDEDNKAKVKQWIVLKFVDKDISHNFDDFTKKYNLELNRFFRDKAPSRDPRLAMLKDFENSLQECVIPKAELKELEYLVSNEFRIKDRMYFELEKLKKRANDPKRILKIKLSEKALGSARDGSVSRSVDASTNKAKSIDLYPRTPGYAVKKMTPHRYIPANRSLNLSAITVKNLVLDPSLDDLSNIKTERSLRVETSRYRTTRSFHRANHRGLMADTARTAGLTSLRGDDDIVEDLMPLKCKISPLLYSGSVRKTATILKNCKLT